MHNLGGRLRRGHMRTAKTIAGITILTMTLGACSPGEELAERLIESQEGVGDIEIDEEDGQVRIEVEDEEGNTSGVIGGGDLPDDFPIDVPDGGEVQAVFQQGSDTTVNLTYDQDFETIKGFYESWVEDSGEEIVNTFESSNPPSAAWTVQSGDEAYTINVVDSGSEVVVTLAVTSNG